MRTSLLLTVALVILLSIFNSALASPAAFSTVRYGGTSNELVQDVVIDASGNLYVIGSFGGSVSFGGSTLVSAGGFDIFMAKYSATGAHVWSQRFGSTNTDAGVSIAVDAFGNVYTTGEYRGSVSVGGAVLIAFGLQDMFVAKYNSAGTHLWSKGFGSNTGGERGTSIAVTESGTVFVTGYFSNTVNFGGSNLVSAGSSDIVLMRMDTNGNHFWSQRFGSTQSEFSTAVTLTPIGELFLGGEFAGSVNFGGGALTSTAGSQDGVIAKYSATGAHQWSRRFGDSGDDNVYAMKFDALGSLVVSGQFQFSADFGGGALTAIGDTDMFLAKYTSAGAHVWSENFSGTNIYAYDLATDAQGNIAVTGGFDESASFGGAPLNAEGLEDVFIARYDAAGVHQWSAAFGDIDFDDGAAVAFDANGDITMAASFVGTVDFGAGPLSSTSPLVNDIVLARYGAYPREPFINSIVDVPNDQGRNVKIAFERTGFDGAGAPLPVVQYEVFRRDDPPPALLTTAAMSTDDLLIAGWQFVGSMPAHHDDDNLVNAPTIGDSTVALGQYDSVFFIRGATSSPTVFYDSQIDSGYSLDNIPPEGPQNFVYDEGLLSWEVSPAADFDYFTIYGSESPVLDGSAELIGHTTDNEFDVSGSLYTSGTASMSHTYYYLTATDHAGNEGEAVRVNTLSGVGNAPPPRALSVNAYPNPFNPRTTIRYDVPAAGRATVTIYDASGARVATLLDGQVPAGSRALTWEGRNHRGEPVGSGVYFVEVRFGGNTKTHKLTLVK